MFIFLNKMIFFRRIKDTLNVSSDHTFGILVKPDEYGAGDLMHGRGPQSYLRGKDRERGLIGAMRQHLKKQNYHNFQDLMSAFKYYDKVSLSLQAAYLFSMSSSNLMVASA